MAANEGYALMIETIPSRSDERANLTILTCKEQPAQNEIIVARTIELRDLRSMAFLVDGRDVEAESVSRTREPGAWAPGPNPLKYRIYGTPLREMVYGTLARELAHLLRSLRAACGIPA